AMAEKDAFPVDNVEGGLCVDYTDAGIGDLVIITMATPSLGNKKYVITFIDDASRFCYVYLLHAKDEALAKESFLVAIKAAHALLILVNCPHKITNLKKDDTQQSIPNVIQYIT
ncbi:zinc finger, CCHC-type containing protein, partial [Tanacetum coccineum]